MSKGTVLETLIIDWNLLKEYLYFVQTSTLFQGVSPRFLVKNEHILKSAFFTPLCPLESRRVVKLLGKLKSVSGDMLGHTDAIICF